VLVAATLFDWGFTGVVIAYALNGVTYALVMMRLGFKRISLSFSFDLPLWRDLLRWSIPLGAAGALNTIYFRIDTILLSELASNRQVGMYGVAYKFVESFIVLPSFFMITLLPEFARLQQQHERVRQIMQKAFAVIGVAIPPMLILTAGFAPEIVRVVGGPGFADAALVLQILMLGVGISYFTGVFNEVLLATNRQGKLFKAMLMILPVNVALNFALIPMWGARGAAVAFTISEFLAFALSAWYCRYIGAFPKPEHGLGVLLAAGCMSLVLLLKLFSVVDSLAPILLLGLGALISLAVYAASLYAFRAMPPELHTGIVVPLWSKFRSLRSAA
jgi:O-antigen/teichoic acid export membrane protein